MSHCNLGVPAAMALPTCVSVVPSARCIGMGTTLLGWNLRKGPELIEKQSRRSRRGEGGESTDARDIKGIFFLHQMGNVPES